MNRLISLFFLSIGFLAIVSCQHDEVSSDSDIDKARTYFQNNASCLAIPSIAAPANTKSCYRENSQYPDWDNAEIMLNEVEKIIQVPLCGPCKIIGGVAHVHEGRVHRLRTSARSFLILKYNGTCTSPEMFISTVLTCGNGGRSIDYISSKDSFEGMVIVSGLDGTTQSIVSYENGIGKSLETTKISLTGAKTLPDNVSGIMFKLAVTAPSTKGGDHDANSEAGMNKIACYRCGATYYGYVWTECPDCGYCDYYNYLYCGNCLQLLEDCICGGYNVCPFCGKLIGKTCNCQGGLNPETPNPEK